MTPSEAAEIEAKKTFNAFVKWSKVTLYWIIGILLVLASCDFGTDTKTGSQYNGAVYAPSNIGE
jgi:hypothetical protein